MRKKNARTQATERENIFVFFWFNFVPASFSFYSDPALDQKQKLFVKDELIGVRGAKCNLHVHMHFFVRGEGENETLDEESYFLHSDALLIP